LESNAGIKLLSKAWETVRFHYMTPEQVDALSDEDYKEYQRAMNVFNQSAGSMLTVPNRPTAILSDSTEPTYT